MQEGEFSLILRQSIMDEMRRIIGESGVQSVFYYLDLIKVLHRPAAFQKRLRSMFRSGSPAIEREILFGLYRRLNIPFQEQKGYDFADYVNLAERTFVASVEKKKEEM
ncbi:MAG: hypothetical protein JRN20_05275 [Nitrososphaerota archaeon]|nr:hypothetical protein [Nitrososphaerota archaeon]